MASTVVEIKLIIFSKHKLKLMYIANCIFRSSLESMHEKKLILNEQKSPKLTYWLSVQCLS